MQHSESVQRQAPPAPFRHPHFETFRDREREAFAREVAASVRLSDALRARLATARVLECHA